MYTWTERHSIPEHTHEMIHYRNAMVKELNFVLSDRYEKIKLDDSVREEFEHLKDLRGKTANRIQKEHERNKVWFDLIYEVLRESLDFKAAEYFIKYFNVPNEAIAVDFYFLMEKDNSIYQQLIKEQAFNSAFGFLRFFPPTDVLHEYTDLLKTSARVKNNSAFLFLIEHLNQEPYDKLLRDNETQSLLLEEYKKSEKEKRLVEARKIAELLKDEDRIHRVSAMEAMINKNRDTAIAHLKEIRNIDDFKSIIKEYYKYAMQDGMKNNDVELFKLAYAYASYGKLSEDGDKKYTQEPAGKLFEYYLTKHGATEAEYFEADKYVAHCSTRFVEDVVAKQMLSLINKNQSPQAKYLKDRFSVEFHPGDYKAEVEVKKFFQNLTETYGIHELPKGEENLLTALDIALLFNFRQKEIDEVNLLLSKFYLIHKKYDKAKKHFVQGNKEITELVVNQLSTLINARDYDGAYKLIQALPVKFTSETRYLKKREVKEITNTDEIVPDQLTKAIITDDIFELKLLPDKFIYQAFEYGFSSGQTGIQFLADLSIPFKKHIEACGKISLYNLIKKLIAEDRISAEILQRSYENYTHPDIFDYIIYILKKLLGLC